MIVRGFKIFILSSYFHERPNEINVILFHGGKKNNTQEKRIYKNNEVIHVVDNIFCFGNHLEDIISQTNLFRRCNYNSIKM